MTCWNKEQLEQMLFDVVDELYLSDEIINEHGQHGTAPAILVRLVLEQKDREIAMLKAGFRDASVICKHPDHNEQTDCQDRAVGCSKHCTCCMGK